MSWNYRTEFGGMGQIEETGFLAGFMGEGHSGAPLRGMHLPHTLCLSCTAPHSCDRLIGVGGGPMVPLSTLELVC